MAEGKWSVGVVMDHERFRSLQLSPDKHLKNASARQPQVCDLIGEASKFTPVRATLIFPTERRIVWQPLVSSW